MPIVYAGRVFLVEVADRRFPNGRTHTIEVVRHAPSVVLIPFETDGRLVIIRQYRAPLDRELWEFPAGRVDAGESAEDAARRGPGDLLVAEVDAAGVDALVAGHHVEQGRLAGAVGPDEPSDLAGRSGQRAVGQRLHAAERLRDAFGPQVRGHVTSPRPRCHRARTLVTYSEAVGSTPRGRNRITARNKAPNRISAV